MSFRAWVVALVVAWLFALWATALTGFAVSGLSFRARFVALAVALIGGLGGADTRAIVLKHFWSHARVVVRTKALFALWVEFATRTLALTFRRIARLVSAVIHPFADHFQTPFLVTILVMRFYRACYGRGFADSVKVASGRIVSEATADEGHPVPPVGGVTSIS